jgi:uncharacterized protein
MDVSRRTVLKGLAGSGVGALAGVGGYGFLHGRHSLALTRETLGVADLPPALAGLRIGLLTDIHRSRWVSHDDVTHAVTILMGERPDVIVLGGDYVTWADRDYMEPAADALAPLRAPHGVFAILGNHDDDRAMPAALAKRNIEVLRDARTHLTVNGEGLELLGIRFWTRRQRDIGALVRGATAPVILLAHDPRRLAEAANLDIRLVLSGHTHGGQVVLPGLGAIAAQKFPIVAGVGSKRRTAIFVSRGVGTVYVPVRINCPPEAAVLTLTAGVSDEEFRNSSGA